MKSIKEKAKKWCSEHSNKGCTEKCDECWQLRQVWGCEQRNMETAYEAGANYVLEQVECLLKDKNTGLVEMWDELMILVEQLKSNQ